MREIMYTSRIKIVREKGPTRRALIEGFEETVYDGVHGGIKMQSIIEEKFMEEGIHIDELWMGSRRHRISKVRSIIGWQRINDLGIPLTEVAWQLGVSTSGILKILQRKECYRES